MKEDLKETLIVQMFNTIKQLKSVVETQQTQLNIIIKENTQVIERVKTLEEKLK